MIAYNVMETGYRLGYIEWVENSVEIAKMHKDVGKLGFLTGPYDQKSIYKFIKKNVIDENKIDKNNLKTYHETFIKSLAGQCVATYILGIKDRHSANYML